MNCRNKNRPSAMGKQLH